jgi:hypothetical protein
LPKPFSFGNPSEIELKSSGEVKMKRIRGLATAVFLTSAVSASPVSAAETLQSPTVADQNSVVVQDGEKSASITLARTTGGITQIAIARPDSFAKAYVTLVTASGPTIEDAAMAVAVLQTFTNLDQQALLAGTGSITLAYNQTKPSYVISELERVKLISPLEAQAARTAFNTLQ